jgi:hypothetical protein
MFQLTLPEEVAEALTAIYSEGVVVLEYGSGGSTFLALDANEENIIYSCETDARWLSELSSEIALRQLSHRFFPVFQDVGQTKEWGYPCFDKQSYDESRGIQFVQAPILPWRVMQRHGVSPDIVFIDGRFRVASFLATYLNVSRPCTVVFDDYRDRECYHVVECILKPSGFIDRTAFFELQPPAGVSQVKSFLEIFAPYLIAEV